MLGNGDQFSKFLHQQIPTKYSLLSRNVPCCYITLWKLKANQTNNYGILLVWLACSASIWPFTYEEWRFHKIARDKNKGACILWCYRLTLTLTTTWIQALLEANSLKFTAVEPEENGLQDVCSTGTFRSWSWARLRQRHTFGTIHDITVSNYL